MMHRLNQHDYDDVMIGLEIHIQLTNLKTKLFCGCSSDYRDALPNTYVCPTCLGLPGALPSVNRRGIEDAIIVGLALNATISRHTNFFRKNYYYPDMSKNFQISQYDKAGGLPIATNGQVEIQVNHEKKNIRITRLQLEEDPARLIHLGSITTSPYTLVDYNRAGIALLEVVTDPEITSPKEARIFLQKLRSIFEHLEVSDGRLEGSMRCDANISLAGGKRVEIKNISSFKEVERALTYEITRQKSLLSKGSTIRMETRHWDEARRVTISLRSKESEHDYRYFPEPDLMPIVISDKWIRELKAKIPELPDARRDRFKRIYKLPVYDATFLTTNKTLADFFEASAKLYPDTKKISNWMMGDLLRWLHEENIEIEEAKITPTALVEMIELIDAGTITGKIAKGILPEMIKTGKLASEVIQAKNLVRMSSVEEIRERVKQVFEENQKAVQDAFIDDKAIHYLIGQVMKATKGKADPELTNKIIKENLERLKTSH